MGLKRELASKVPAGSKERPEENAVHTAWHSGCSINVNCVVPIYKTCMRGHLLTMYFCLTLTATLRPDEEDKLADEDGCWGGEGTSPGCGAGKGPGSLDQA